MEMEFNKKFHPNFRGNCHIQAETINTQLPSNSNLRLNNGISSTNSFFKFANQRTTGLNQNGQLPQVIGHSTLGKGQLGLTSQIITEVRRTIFSPNGVHVQRLIDYSPIQTQPSLSLNEMIPATDVVTSTRLLNPNSTRHRILNSNNNFPPNRITSSINLPRHNFFSPSPASQDRFQNLRQSGHELNIVGFNKPQAQKGQEEVAPLASVSTIYNLGTKNQNHWALNWDQNLNPHPKFYDFSKYKNNHVLKSGNAFDYDHIGSSNVNCDNDKEYDGKTHSLTTSKYGPYTCPKCLSVFSTSQCFAAHISSHYKFETKEEKRTRLAAKHKKKNLRFTNSRNGLTVMPKSVRAMANAFSRARNIVAFKNQGEDKRLENFNLKKEIDQQDLPSGTYAVAGVMNGAGGASIRVKEEPK